MKKAIEAILEWWEGVKDLTTGADDDYNVFDEDDDKLFSDLKDASPLPRKEVISVQPGDVIVLSCSLDLPTSHKDRIKMDLRKAFPSNKSIFLGDSMTLEVYREQEAKPISPIEALEASRKQGKSVDGLGQAGVVTSVDPLPRYLDDKELQDTSTYTKHKNTCTECDKGPCDRTLHNPCDAPPAPANRETNSLGT